MEEKESEKANRIWNRALSSYATPLLVGDWALIEMLRLHCYIMNGGMLHGIEGMGSEDWEFQIKAYRLFGLDDVAELLVETKKALPIEDDTGALEERANARYCDLVQNDRRVFDVFRTYLRTHPEKFAP